MAVFTRELGTYAQRLATIARGDAVCTTFIPISTIPLADTGRPTSAPPPASTSRRHSATRQHAQQDRTTAAVPVRTAAHWKDLVHDHNSGPRVSDRRRYRHPGRDRGRRAGAADAAEP